MISETPLLTEEENPRAVNLDQFTVLEIVRLMNDEDARVADAVGRVLPDIARAVDGIVARLKGGGRLIYVGTGTSGRLGVLDAAECVPTFGVSPEMVQGIIAGGYDACYRAVEASEDDEAAGARDLEARNASEKDAVVGIAASGRTPYTIGALKRARSLGALTVAVTCNTDAPISAVAEISIVPLVGPEVIAGSTRLKAGTAQKMVLNMLSTATMVGLGLVTGNRMTNMGARNDKLRARALRIIRAETGIDEDRARLLMDGAGGDLRVALVMAQTGAARSEAESALVSCGWVVREAYASLLGRDAHRVN